MLRIYFVVALMFVLQTGTALATSMGVARDAFFSKNITQADDIIKKELLQNPENYETHLFHALTRILNVFEKTQGADPLLFTDSFRELLQKFGFHVGNISNLYIESPEELAMNSPTGGDVQKFVEDVLLLEIRKAIDEDLAVIDENFKTFISPQELSKVEIYNSNQTEIDYGDVKLLQAVLSVLSVNLLSYLSYDTNVDIDEISKLTGDVYLQKDIYNKYPALLKVRAGKEHLLIEAKNRVKSAIIFYHQSTDFIMKETDSQEDDLFTIDIKDSIDESDFRRKLSQIYAALDGPTYLEIDENEKALINLDRFFDATFDIRSILPPIIVDLDNGKVDRGSNPDKTFNRVIPPAEFSFSNGLLHIPVVNVAGLGSFDVKMSLTNQNNFEFSLLSAIPVVNLINQPATFYLDSGLLDIPITDVKTEPNDKNPLRFSVEMQHKKQTENFMFNLTNATPLD